MMVLEKKQSQVDLIIKLVKPILAERAVEVEVCFDKEREQCEAVQAALRNSVWSRQLSELSCRRDHRLESFDLSSQFVPIVAQDEVSRHPRLDVQGTLKGRSLTLQSNYFSVCK